jgi:hypothetical protein
MKEPEFIAMQGTFGTQAHSTGREEETWMQPAREGCTVCDEQQQGMGVYASNEGRVLAQSSQPGVEKEAGMRGVGVQVGDTGQHGRAGVSGEGQVPGGVNQQMEGAVSMGQGRSQENGTGVSATGWQCG